MIAEFEKNAEQMAKDITGQMGKPLSQAKVSHSFALGCVSSALIVLTFHLCLCVRCVAG